MTDNHPRVEVGIPTIEGREMILMSCLVSLLGSRTGPLPLTICTTNTAVRVGDRDDDLFVNRFLGSMALSGWKVSVLHDREARGPRFAVQELLDHCRADWLLRVDDDVIITPDLLGKLLETPERIPVSERELAAVAAPVNGFGVSFVDYFEYWSPQYQADKPHLFGLGRAEHGNDNFAHHSGCPDIPVWAEVDFLAGYCILLSTAAVRAVGGYWDCPHHHKEDWSLTLKMRAAGYRPLIRGDAVAYHHHYRRDASDEYRHARSREDHAIWDELRRRHPLDPGRHVGVLRPR